MNTLMTLSIDIIDQLNKDEMIFLCGGSAMILEATNNGSGVCHGGPNNSDGTCYGGPNNGGGVCHKEIEQN